MKIFGDIFGIDSRSLGLTRILLGYILVSDAITKLIYAQEFFTDEGVLPRVPYVRDYLGSWSFSFHLASGDLWFQVLLIALGILFSFQFMIGYRWRFSAIASFLLLCSLQNRNTAIVTAADDVIRLCLFWFMFLPTPGAFAVDGIEKSARVIKGFATTALMTQLLLIYLFTALWKWDPVYTKEFSAVYYSLNLDYYAKPAGIFLRNYLGVTKVLTAATMVLEIFGPIMALIPVWPLRLATALAFIGFHFGLFTTLSLGTFSGMMMAYWVLFIPAQAWDFKMMKTLSQILEMLFDKIHQVLPTEDMLPLPAPVPGFLSRHRILELSSLSCLIFVIAFNASGVTDNPNLKMTESLEHFANSANINQTWWMFAPRPSRSDGWFVMDAELKDGTHVDMMTGKAPVVGKPTQLPEIYNIKEWQTYFLRMWEDEDNVIAPAYADYLCDHHQEIKHIQMVFNEEYTPPLGKPFGPIQEHLIWEQDCD